MTASSSRRSTSTTTSCEATPATTSASRTVTSCSFRRAGHRCASRASVLRPATYEAKGNESVAATIRAAGGFGPAADRRRVQIERIVPPTERTTAGRDRTVLDVTADAIETTPVRGGDVIRVLEVSKRVTKRVFVHGDVWSPGPIGYTDGMTLYDAFRRVGGLRPDAFLGDVLITRLNADSTLSMLRSAVYDTTGRPAANLTLADGDDVTVFSTTDMRPKRYVTVGGAVRKPGIAIPYRDGMTLRDAVLLAGGLQEGALLTEAEIARLPESRAAGTTAVPTRVALDSSYLFDRSADGRVRRGRRVVVPSTPCATARAHAIRRRDDQVAARLAAAADGVREGEVRYPSQYALITKTERLSDVLKRAGGLTPAAYPNGVVFYRKTGNVGRIGIDLPQVLKDRFAPDNLQLVDGDSIVIPKFNPVVVMRGAVNSPVGVAYVDGASLELLLAIGRRRDRGGRRRCRIRHAAERQGRNAPASPAAVPASKPQPLPGSTVIVPTEGSERQARLGVDRDRGDVESWVRWWRSPRSIKR